jgi:hypothetical protein
MIVDWTMAAPALIIGIVVLLVLIYSIIVQRRDKKERARQEQIRQAKIQKEQEIAEQKRREYVESLRTKIGDEFTDAILKKDILLGMHPKMVELAWGKPNNIDNKTITAKTTKERWVYGTPRYGAKYITLKDNRVQKIEM